MAEKLPDADLAKAKRNFERIAEFVASHRDHPAEPAARTQLDRLWGATLSLCERLQPLLQTAGAKPPRPAEPPPTTAGGALEAARIGRFADFTEQLEGWFRIHDASFESDAGVAALVGLYGGIATTRDVVSGMLDRMPAPSSADHGTDEDAAPDADESATGHAVVGGSSGTPAPPPPAPVQPRSTRRLLLADLDERPLLQEFQGVIELTDAAKELLSEFLDDHGIELSGYERHKLDDRLLRWIQATPDGQVLVLKIGGLKGRLEPFPSYIPRAQVEDEISRLRGYE